MMAIISIFSPAGGISVEENWDKVVRFHVDILDGIDGIDVKSKLPAGLRR